MKTQGSWIPLSSVHARQPGRRVTRRSFVIAEVSGHELKTQRQRGETTLSEKRTERRWETNQMSSRLSLSPALPPGEPWVWRPGSDQVCHPSARWRSHRCGVPPSAPRCRTHAWWGKKNKKQSKKQICCWCFLTFFLSNTEVKTGTGFPKQVICRTA